MTYVVPTFSQVVTVVESYGYQCFNSFQVLRFNFAETTANVQHGESGEGLDVGERTSCKKREVRT